MKRTSDSTWRISPSRRTMRYCEAMTVSDRKRHQMGALGGFLVVGMQIGVPEVGRHLVGVGDETENLPGAGIPIALVGVDIVMPDAGAAGGERQPEADIDLLELGFRLLLPGDVGLHAHQPERLGRSHHARQCRRGPAPRPSGRPCASGAIRSRSKRSGRQCGGRRWPSPARDRRDASAAARGRLRRQARPRHSPASSTRSANR